MIQERLSVLHSWCVSPSDALTIIGGSGAWFWDAGAAATST
jgi:hypothetical protein